MDKTRISLVGQKIDTFYEYQIAPMKIAVGGYGECARNE